jgi:hypothetical protein
MLKKFKTSKSTFCPFRNFYPQQVGTPTLPTAISLKSSSSRRALLVFNLFFKWNNIVFQSLSHMHLYFKQVCRPSLPAMSVDRIVRKGSKTYAICVTRGFMGHAVCYPAIAVRWLQSAWMQFGILPLQFGDCRVRGCILVSCHCSSVTAERMQFGILCQRLSLIIS